MPRTTEDVDAPGLRVRAPGTTDLASLAAGFEVMVDLADAAELQLELRSFALEPLRRGMRGSSERPRMTRIAAAEAMAPAGRSSHTLALEPAAGNLIAMAAASEPVRARLVVQARFGEARVGVANRRVAIQPS